MLPPAAVLRTGVRVCRRAWRQALRLPPRPDTADRVWLEEVLLPAWSRCDDIHTVLLVGTRWYTRHYPALLPRQHCITIDSAPSAARHGASGAHLVADVRHVDRHLAPGSVDAVLLNGVFGWGLDDAPALDAALRALARVLRPGGELVFGWNDDGRHCPVDWRLSPAWSAFAPLPFAPAAGARYLTLATDNRHRLDFFARR